MRDMRAERLDLSRLGPESGMQNGAQQFEISKQPQCYHVLGWAA